jgi:hypothetical protein
MSDFRFRRARKANSRAKTSTFGRFTANFMSPDAL